MGIRVTVIGESGGAPLPGGATSCYLVEGGGNRLLLDIGSGAISLLSRIIPFDSVNDIIISHFHSDHSADAGVAVYSRLISMQLGRDVQMLTFHAPSERDLANAPYSRVRLIDSGLEEMIGPFAVSYMRTRHPVPCFAVRLSYGGKSLVYTADGALTDELVSFSSNADILIAECSFYPGMSGSGAGHMNASDVASLASAASPQNLVISHLPVYGDRKDILSYVSGRWNGRVLLASTFLALEV